MVIRDYLKRNLSDYFYAIAFVLAVSFALNQSAAQVTVFQSPPKAPVIILDPGHGGMDSGTKTADAVPESRINLEISRRLYDLFWLIGIECTMTRHEDKSLDTEGNSVRERKNSDLRNRVKAVNDQKNGILISIHQNHFSQSLYSGPQVFYGQLKESEALAQHMQGVMNSTLAPDSHRSCKPAQGIYLMEHIQRPGILIECGFLSNEAEAKKLVSEGYQKKIVCCIACAAAVYVHQAAVG